MPRQNKDLHIIEIVLISQRHKAVDSFSEGRSLVKDLHIIEIFLISLAVARHYAYAADTPLLSLCDISPVCGELPEGEA